MAYQTQTPNIFMEPTFTRSFPRIPLNLQLALVDRDFDENGKSFIPSEKV